TMQVSSTRFMPVSFPGSEIFDNTRNFDDAPTAFKGNGNSTSSDISVAFYPQPPAQDDTGKRYEISTADGINYDVVEYQPGNPSPRPVTSILGGGTVTFDGIEVTISGVGEPGDVFEVFVPSKNVFENMALFVDSLERPGVAGVIGGVEFIIGNIDAALETALRARAQIGSQLVELEQLKDFGSELDLEYASTLSRLQDVDYADAISRLTQQQTFLEAAQQSFMKVSGLSLFNFLS
ncbi:MAG: flagellar hook-associated protein 3, partial [Azoarcus sp.]|nr:flagellar hook-associated protein 3 [Azoarcus sp.]